MVNYNYYCIGCTCGAKEKDTTFIIEKETKTNDLFELPTDEERCPINDSVLKLMGQNLAGGFAKFASSSPDERREVLKKRSHTHYKKEIQEKVRESDRDLMRSFTK